jgi:hypothetical protein
MNIDGLNNVAEGVLAASRCPIQIGGRFAVCR